MYFLQCIFLLGCDQGLYRSWKTWRVLDFTLAFSRTGKSWKKTAGPGKFWKSVKLK